MAEVKRGDHGEANGWWTLPYWRGKLSHCLSTETLLQLLSSPISRKAFPCQLLRQTAPIMNWSFGGEGIITKQVDQ